MADMFLTLGAALLGRSRVPLEGDLAEGSFLVHTPAVAVPFFRGQIMRQSQRVRVSDSTGSCSTTSPPPPCSFSGAPFRHLPLLDVLFGTCECPAGRGPTAYGVAGGKE